MMRIESPELHRLLRGAAKRILPADHLRPGGRCLLSPEWIILCVNNVCNLHCRMCDVGLGEQGTMFWANLIGSHPQDMTLEMLEQVLDQAAGFFPRPKIGLTYTEPLIHPKILDFARLIVERGFYCSITSNGTFLPKRAEALVEIGVHELTISVDGPPEVHDRIRGGKNSFAKLYQGIEQVNAVKARLGKELPVVQLSFTISDQNQTRIVDFLDAVEPLRARDIFLSHLNFITDGMAAAHNARHHGDWTVARSNLGPIDLETLDARALWAELQRVDAWVAARGTGGPRVGINPRLNGEAEVARYYRDPQWFVGGHRCTSPFEMMMVRTDGSVVPAHGRCFDYAMGNMRDTSLPEIWRGPAFNGFRETLRAAGGTLPACARCCGVVGKPTEAR